MSNLKVLRSSVIKTAKERIASGNYDEIAKLHSVKPVDSIVVIANKCLSADDIYNYYETVAAIQEEDERKLGAVGALIDEELYIDMSDEERQRYVLKIASFYKCLCDEYYHRRNRK